MATTGYGLVITATDRATAPIRAVNKSLMDLTAPVKKVGDEMKRFSELSGMAAALRGLSALTPALGALGAAASVGEVVEATTRWASFTQNLAYTANRAGMTAGALAGMEGAVRLAGGSAEGAAGGDGESERRDVRNSHGTWSGFSRLSALGRHRPRKYRERHRDGRDDVAEAALGLRKIPETTFRAQTAKLWFGGAADDILKLVDAGPEALNDFLRRAKEASPKPDTAAAIAYMRAQTELTLAAEGLGNSILAKFVAGGLTGLMESATRTVKNCVKTLTQWDPPKWFRVIMGMDPVPPDVQEGTKSIVQLSLMVWRRI